VISGPALERYYRARGGKPIHLPEIAQRTKAGEALARAILARFRDKFREAIAAVTNILAPDAIEIGGGVSNLDLLYGEETRAAILRYLADNAGVFGAAMLCARTQT
jgi:fructokinase